MLEQTTRDNDEADNMSDAVWYYAEGERQKGPVSAEELKRIVVAGRVKPTDLVWQPGMDDWVAAKTIRGLVPEDLLDIPLENLGATSIDAGFDDSMLRTNRRRRRRSKTSWNEIAKDWNISALARIFVVAGVLLIIVGRGCDVLSAKFARRQQVLLEVAKSDLEADFRKQRIAIQSKLIEAQRSATTSPQDQPLVANYQQQLIQLERDYADRQTQLGQSTWLEMDIASRTAVAHHVAWQHWYETYVVAGSVILAIGSLALGFIGSSAERWGGWILLAVLLGTALISRGASTL